MRGIRTKTMLIGLTLLLSGRSYANEEITVDLPGGAQMEFVGIAPGTFTMGDAIQTSHQVTLTQGFYLGKYEITQGQWKAVLGTSPWSVDSYCGRIQTTRRCTFRGTMTRHSSTS